MLLKKLLPFTLLCLLLHVSLHAQRHRTWIDGREITTDYNSCTQGVKDSLGNWIIQPKYDDITMHFDRYIVTSGGKMGVLDYNGKEMIPLVYEMIRPVTNWSYFSNGLGGYYMVGLGDHVGVTDSVNHIIVPVSYLLIRANPDSTFTCSKGKKRYDIYNIHGTGFQFPWKSKVFPDYEARHAISVRKKTIFGRKWGVLDDSGHVVLEQKYERITGYDYTSTLCVEKDGKYGFCSLAGQWIWPMTFSYGAGEDWYMGSMYRMPGEYGVGPACSDGRWGLITIKGDTLLPFKYSAIAPLDYGVTDLWRVTIDSLYGVFDVKNGWVLRPESSELITIETYATSDSVSIALLVAEQNGKWGALTTNGQQVLPFTHDQFLQLTEKQYVFMKGDSLFYLGLSESWDRNTLIAKAMGTNSLAFFFDDFDYTVSSEAKSIPDSKSFSIYTTSSGLQAFYDPALTHDSIESDSVVYSLSTGKTYGMRVPDSIIMSARFFVSPMAAPHSRTKLYDLYSLMRLSDIDSSYKYNAFLVMHNSNQPVLTRVVEQINPNRTNVAYIVTGTDELIKTDGTLIYSGDSILSIDEDYHGRDGSLYFTVTRFWGGQSAIDTLGRTLVPSSKNGGIGDFSSRYTWYATNFYSYEWKLVNSLTHKPVLGKKIYSEKPYPIWDSITIVENDKYGMRLLNIDRNRYLTTYGFNAIIPLSQAGNLFAVKTCNEHVGVMDASGKFVLDTIYEAFTPIEYDTFIHSTDHLTEEFFYRFFRQLVFFNASSAVTLECTTGRIIPHEESQKLMWAEFAAVIPLANAEVALTDSFYVYSDYSRSITLFLTTKDSAALLPWQKECITDTLYRPKRFFGENQWRYYFPCQYCNDRGQFSESFGWRKNYVNNIYFMLRYRTDSLLSFSRVEPPDSWSSELERRWFSNVMIFPDGPHQMTLDSMFNPATDWRNFIINTVIGYVNTHMGIEGDCHNPAGIPSLLSENFLITAEGLLLYPPEFVENGEQLVLTVPWKDVDVFLRKDVRTRLPINGK